MVYRCPTRSRSAPARWRSPRASWAMGRCASWRRTVGCRCSRVPGPRSAPPTDVAARAGSSGIAIRHREPRVALPHVRRGHRGGRRAQRRSGGATTVLVRVIEHVTYGYSEGPLLVGVLYTPVERRIAGPAIGCALAGLGWWLLRQRATVPGLGESIRRDRPFDHRPMAVDALLQVLAVGSGASLGREQAPRLFAASFTERVIKRSSLSVLQRRILLGSAAGAGLAAVYNVPAAGTLFALGIVLNSWRPLAVLVAVATSSIATVTVWPLSHGQPSFVWPDTGYTWKVLLFAIAAMPIGMLVGTGFTWIVDRAKRAALKTSWLLIPAVGLAGLVTGISSIRMPQLPGNGKSIILETLSGGDKLIPIAVVVLLKPLLTALFLRAGAVGTAR